MSNITWKYNHIEIEVPKSVKKITGTRLASILGYNKWSTPFQAFCEITKAFEKPFADTIYTVAGKTIEPKQAQYLKDRYHMDIVTPTEIDQALCLHNTKQIINYLNILERLHNIAFVLLHADLCKNWQGILFDMFHSHKCFT